jgi:hypothetical protein
VAACEICYQSQPSLLGVCPHAFVYAFASICLRGCRIGARHPAWLPARFAINPNSVCLGSVPAFLSMQLLASARLTAGPVPGTRRRVCPRTFVYAFASICFRGCRIGARHPACLPARFAINPNSVCSEFARSLLGVCPHAFVQVSCLALMNAVLLYQQQRNARICDSIKGFPF